MISDQKTLLYSLMIVDMIVYNSWLAFKLTNKEKPLKTIIVDFQNDEDDILINYNEGE